MARAESPSRSRPRADALANRASLALSFPIVLEVVPEMRLLPFSFMSAPAPLFLPLPQTGVLLDHDGHFLVES